MTYLHLLVALMLALPLSQSSPQSSRADAWGPYRFLIGEWAGEGQGQPGNTTGTAVFKLDLDGRVMIRTSQAAVPARGTEPGYLHKDLLLMYRDTPGQPVKALYSDNEDHTIHYTVSASADGKNVVFVSDITPSAPRFRLVYTQVGPDAVDVKFEMAPPGSPEAFKVYTQGLTRRVKAKG